MSGPWNKWAMHVFKELKGPSLWYVPPDSCFSASRDPEGMLGKWPLHIVALQEGLGIDRVSMFHL